jgi:hypothetical protein
MVFPFDGKEGAAVGRIWKFANGDLALASSVMDIYLAERNPYYEGHPLSKLAQDWMKFSSRVAKKNGANHEHGSNNGGGNRAATNRDVPDLSKKSQPSGNPAGR